MADKTLTDAELVRRRDAARERANKARATVARLDRELKQMDRKRLATQKIVLGACLLRAVDQYPQHVDGLRRMLLPYVTRPGDREALDGTPFEFREPVASAQGAPASEREA